MFRSFAYCTCAAIALAALACESSTLEPEGSSAAVSGTSVSAEGAGYDLPSNDAQVAAIHALQSAFHGALNASDFDAVHALWTADATLDVITPGGPVSASGPDEIAAFFQGSGPFVNGWAALAPTYKTVIEIQGNRAEYAFECVYVQDTGNLAGQPVIAHLNASGIMRKVGDRWLFEHFQGGVGPL